MQKSTAITLVTEVQFIRTTELLVKKVVCIRRIALLSTIKTGLMAFIAMILGLFFKSLYEGDTLDLLMFLSLMSSFYAIVATFVINGILATNAALKDVINDVLNIRNSRASPSTTRSYDKNVEQKQ